MSANQLFILYDISLLVAPTSYNFGTAGMGTWALKS